MTTKPDRFQVVPIGGKGKVIGYMVFDSVTCDEAYLVTVSSELPAAEARRRVEMQCAELNRIEATK